MARGSDVPATEAPAREMGAGTQALLLIIGLVLLIAAPFFVYPVFLMTLLCFGLFAAAFNLLLGYTGLLSFGHAAFFGGAAYFTAHAAKVWGWPPEAGILLGVLGGDRVRFIPHQRRHAGDDLHDRVVDIIAAGPAPLAGEHSFELSGGVDRLMGERFETRVFYVRGCQAASLRRRPHPRGRRARSAEGRTALSWSAAMPMGRSFYPAAAR